MTFHEVRFPTSLSYGAVGGPERRTEIVTLANGAEERNTPWSHSRRRYDAGLGLRSLDDIDVLVQFFEARRGQLYGFRWKDWSDYKSSTPLGDVDPADQELGTGDGVTTEFQLVKRYGSGAQFYDRPIEKPVDGAVRIAVDGSELALTTDFTVDAQTGVVTFVTAPANGAAITAGFEFDVPVRFDIDQVEISLSSFRAGEAPNVPVIEVRV